MEKVLHILASPRLDLSFSYRLGQGFIEAYLKSHPEAGSEVLDLYEADLPEFDAPAAAAKYSVLSGQEPQDEAARVWQRVIEIINHFKSADMYVLSCPMWNFSIPYRLKHYIDIIVQPGLTFSYSRQEGYSGLVTDKRAVLALARGGEYPQGTDAAARDAQSPYLRDILAFIGIADVRAVVVESTVSEQADENLAAAIERARDLADRM